MKLLRITTVAISLRVLLKGQLEFMSVSGIDVLAVSAAGADVAKLNIPHRAVAMTREITPFRDLLALIQIIIIIIKFRPDVVHTHTPKAGLLGMLASWICRIPVRIHTIGGLPWLEYTGFKRRLLKFVEVLTIRAATDTLINSFNLKSILKSELPSLKNEIRVIGKGSTNGIDSSYFSLMPELTAEANQLRIKIGASAEDIVFCFVGRLTLHKGITELVNAFDSICKNYPHVHLLLVGYVDSDREPLSKQIEERIYSGNGITVTGLVDDVRPWLVASDMLVFPSYREGFPNVLMQAGCLGIPVIASDINGCNEILSGNEYGTLFPPKDTEALKSVMRSFLDDPEPFKKKALSLRSYITLNYDQSLIWSELLDFYRRKFTLKKTSQQQD